MTPTRKPRSEYLKDGLRYHRAECAEWKGRIERWPTDAYYKEKFLFHDRRARWYERELKSGKMLGCVPGTPLPRETNPAGDGTG